MTWPPEASIRSAAAITSITMKGGTSLRAAGASSPSTRFLSVASSIDFCYFLLPWIMPQTGHIPRLVGHTRYPTNRQSPQNALKLRASQENNRPDRGDRRRGGCAFAAWTGPGAREQG